MHRFNIHPHRMEKIQAIRFNVGWKPECVVKITPDKIEAIVEEAQDKPDLKIYTDGSRMNGSISASAVLYSNRVKKVALCYRLGSSK